MWKMIYRMGFIENNIRISLNIPYLKKIFPAGEQNRRNRTVFLFKNEWHAVGLYLIGFS
jgi:hypothetical protein